jgi:hypothetical protein
VAGLLTLVGYHDLTDAIVGEALDIMLAEGCRNLVVVGPDGVWWASSRGETSRAGSPSLGRTDHRTGDG